MIVTYICEFVGGRFNGKRIPLEVAEQMTDRRSEDLSEVRAFGGLVYRAELDNKPEFEGYCGPMWDGTRNGGSVAVLRYESWDVYNMISD